MKTCLVVVSNADSNEISALRAALHNVGLSDTYNVVVTNRTVSVVNMEQEVYAQAKNDGYQIRGYEEDLDAIAEEIATADEYLSQKTCIAIRAALAASRIPHVEDSKEESEDA